MLFSNLRKNFQSVIKYKFEKLKKKKLNRQTFWLEVSMSVNVGIVGDSLCVLFWSVDPTPEW